MLALCSATATAGELTVSAAASLTNAFKEVGSAYQAATGTHVQLNFAASGALLQQIVHGAPVDVFASADEETMDQAGRHQVVAPASRIDFTANSLVVVVPRDAAVLPRSLSALTSADIRRVAIGLPASVPVGRYAKAALERAALWAAIEAKVIGAQSVRQVLDYVARGEVDAGFVYATDAALMPGQVRVAFTVATASPVRYPIAAVAGSSALAEARRFIAFVASAPGQAILAKYGFGPP
ncbi:MAG: molybdate ABC transporter substrate-binding protein [Caldimonas sp.]